MKHVLIQTSLDGYIIRSYGPFGSEARAKEFASKSGITSYTIRPLNSPHKALQSVSEPTA